MTARDHNPSSTHPPLPPTPEDEQFSRLRLLRSRRVGVSTYKRLLTEYGTAQNALAALPEVARAAGVQGYAICPEGVIFAEMKAARAAGARLIDFDVSEYPQTLREISDAPPFLWAIGDVAMLARPMISIVGARNASSLGGRMARGLARDLGAAGFVVVSGLARGIDTVAHQSALASGTIAVQAGGVDVIYPAENAELALSIAASGLRLSEQPMGLQPMARHFPSRNRIISGLSRATIVVEAAGKSGSLITARDALDQGREVFAVPGHPMDARAAGCNMLLRDGATLIRGAADVIETIGQPAVIATSPTNVTTKLPLAQKTPLIRSATTGAQALQSLILDRLSPSPIAEDQLIRDLHVSPAAVAPALLDLELDGQITRQPGGMLARLT
ncbi:MAG: DNA-processing protein DprA [Pseudomonadota bacterium]